MADVVARVRADYDAENGLEPYYIYGHPIEIAQRLSIKDQSDINRYRKYPLIALITDFTETHGNTIDYDYTAPFKLLIVGSTKPEYTSEERYEATFKPVLYPIYSLLIEKLFESPYTAIVDPDLIEHQKIDRLFWGRNTENGNVGLVFNDFLDAIELNFEPIKILKTNPCEDDVFTITSNPVNFTYKIENDGNVEVFYNVEKKIYFETPHTVNNYTLNINVYDINGDIVGYTLVEAARNYFIIRADKDGRVHYDSKQ